jgi:CheY-like chemotaxis protein
MHILVVDDDDAIRSLWTKLLQRTGHQARGAAHGQEALDYLRDTELLPQIILLDLMMPTMNGWEFLKERKHQPRLAAIPVVVISAADFRSSYLAFYGVATYLQKPVAMQTLLETVAQFGV